MNQDILLSKIVPNPTDTAWAQAYTTLNVYITLSIESSNSKIPVTSYGKELLEKLQREFFALDEKTLENIKKAVGNVSKSISEDYDYSIIVGAIVNDILYLVIASEGQVVIKRDERVGIIAKGVKGELHGFSGKLKHDDIIILQTGDFTKKIPLHNLSEYISSKDVSEIAENITPIIHEASKGTESAIIIQYKNLSASQDLEITPTEEEESARQEHENLWAKPQENRNIEELVQDTQEEEIIEEAVSQKRPPLMLPKINFKSKKTLIALAILVLILVFTGGILYQANQQNRLKSEAEFNAIYKPAKEKFDEGLSLASLNTTLALEDLAEALEMTNAALKNYKEGSSEHSRLLQLQSQIQNEINSLGGEGSAENVREFLKPSGNLKSITAISARAGELVVLDSEGEQVVRVGIDGKLGRSYDLESKASHIASDDRFIYTLGTSVTRIDKGNGSVTRVVEEAKGKGIDLFGSNFYILDGKDIRKYRAPSEESTSYFTTSPDFKGTPVSMSISGSVWVIEDNGTLSRFTRGVKDDIQISGLKAPFGAGSQIYADPDSENVYVMDVKNQRVVQLTSEGEFTKQYEGSFIKNSTSFAIDEQNGVGYVVSNNVITSFDL